MRTPSFSKAVVLFGLLVPTTACFAWGRDGHKIVAEIAWCYLTPEARAAVGTLLQGQSMPDVANWADEILSRQDYRWSAPLHYADVPPGADAFAVARDCPKQGCVVSAIIRYDGLLRRRDAGADERIEALKFLIHFVADVHQPLHVGRAGDRGGNDIKVEFLGERLNLHRLWDYALIEHTKKPWQEYARALRDGITPGRLAQWRSTDPVQWANESYRLAVSHAYAIPENGRLGEAYFDRNIPIVNERLAMAAVRLATMLNSELSASASGRAGTGE
jgi:hypothetical protein